MAHYIDADRLRAEIEKRIKSIESCPFIEAEFGAEERREGKIQGYNEAFALIDSLQQEQPELPKIGMAEYYYHKGVCEGISQGHAGALKILDEFAKRKADPVIVIKQQEQPEVDYNEFEKLFDDFCKRNKGHHITSHDACMWFWELGLNARKKD